MTTPAITSVFNDGYIAQAYEDFRRDPGSVDESWRQFFQFAQSLAGAGAAAGAPGGAGADAALLGKVAGAASLMSAIRTFGHLAVQIDPLGCSPKGAQELTPAFHGLTEADLAAIPAAALGFGDDARFATAADVIAMLRRRYMGRLGIEFSHLSEEKEREWIRRTLREEKLNRPPTNEEKVALLRRLTEVDGLERFLGRAFQGKKRFSIEGTDVMVPMLDEAIDEAADLGAREVVIGMAHRGRLNVLVHILGKPYATLFAEFEGRFANQPESETGDVKYHMGYEGERTTANGKKVAVRLMPNPSHLEFVNPVINGVARARQRDGKGGYDEDAVLTICIHGDAAFIGEGVVAETFNMSRLRGYAVGGTLHLIANNQVGFTTDPTDSRSTHYASDLAKGFNVPVIHVNADDAGACMEAVRIAIAYRQEFNKDVLIDLVGYRRHGHNETDEPAFTQPELYKAIRAHPTPRQVWAKRLADEGVMSDADAQRVDAEFSAKLDGILDESRKSAGAKAAAQGSPEAPAAPPAQPIVTAVDAALLRDLNERLLTYPEGFTPHARLAKVLERRRDAIQQGGIEWGQAEALAFASLLVEGTSIRLTGQDAERGTFGHRNAVLHDANTGAVFTPLAALPQAKAGARFEVFNSPLTETAVMGFDYGYSVAAPDTLALWEAQYGDFVNVAQTIIDQFVLADRAKWGQDNGLVLMLPHGYEGGGPEHSSARLERFLQQAAEGNCSVAYPSTSAQYFHVLRRQAKRSPRRPLVLMQPKSFLRLAEAASTLEDLAAGTFRAVIDDARVKPAEVTRVVLCTGKMYWDLALAGERPAHVALVRVEELYPFPREALAEVLARYPKATDVVWAQEEPQNMGAWTHMMPRLAGLLDGRLPRYVGRPERASPAEGYESAHKAEQARIVAEALAPGAEGPAGKGTKAKAGAKG
jgi:2-oxoglutarate dehydrogenase E1 component